MPSSQDAATGAFSAPKQQPAQTTQTKTTVPPAKPAATHRAATRRAGARRAVRRRRPGARAIAGVARPAQPATPTLAQAPAESNPPQEEAQQEAQPPAAPPTPTPDTGLTDEELQQRNLPPLRGPWIRIQRQPNPVSPRAQAEMQLRSIESGYSPWLGGTGVVSFRPGSPGFDYLAALEAPFEASMPLGAESRVTVVARPVFLDSGQADGSSTLAVEGVSAPGAPPARIAIPQPIGSLMNTALTPPAQQTAVGIGGEVQLAFPHVSLSGGYTPEGFLLATFTGRAMLNPGNGPLTLNFSREPVRDSQLSYAGLRDPSAAPDALGQIWGGVIANQGEVQFAHGDAESGFYVGAGGQYLTGHNVETNNRYDGDGGAWWRVKALPEYGSLSVGANFFAMRYAHNENAFTYGMGGYFSPQYYFLANVPFTFSGHYGTRWHYNILGSLGVQAFQEDSTPLFPIAASGLESSETVTIGSETYGDLTLPSRTSVGANYDVRSQVSYQIGAHLFAEGFLTANNSRNYQAVTAGFSIHYLFRPQPSTAAGPTGIFPTDGLRPFTVP
jgi:hypothetical protein